MPGGEEGQGGMAGGGRPGWKGQVGPEYIPLPVVGRGLCPLDDDVKGLDGLQLQHNLVQGADGLRPAQIEDNPLAVVQHKVGRHS